jgi:pentatricopeptide repeat protein
VPRRPRSSAIEHQDAVVIRKLLDEMRLMEVCLSERISGRCDDVEHHLDERREEPCDETSSTRSPVSTATSLIRIRTLPATGSICSRSSVQWPRAPGICFLHRASLPCRAATSQAGIRRPQEDRELVQPPRRVESATCVESSVPRASSTELDREFIAASAFVTASVASSTSALEAGAHVDVAGEPEFPPRVTLDGHPDDELLHVEGAVVRPLLEEREQQHGTAQRVIVARGQSVLHRQYQLDSSPLDSCNIFAPERPADREMVEASAVMVVWAYDAACDRVGVQEVKHACEVGCSGGEMCLFTDLLGDLLCRIHRSPDSLMLVVETTIGTNSTEIAGIVRGCAKTAVSVGTTQQAKDDPIYTKVGSILGLRVSPNHWRKGMGKKLADREEDEVVQASYTYNIYNNWAPLEDALRLFDRMCMEHDSPRTSAVNLGSFNVMVDAYCHAERGQYAIKVFGKMPRRGLCQMYSSNNLIDWLGKNKLVGKSEGWYMEEAARAVLGEWNKAIMATTCAKCDTG